jgi:hypothetical protein
MKRFLVTILVATCLVASAVLLKADPGDEGTSGVPAVTTTTYSYPPPPDGYEGVWPPPDGSYSTSSSNDTLPDTLSTWPWTDPDE